MVPCIFAPAREVGDGFEVTPTLLIRAVSERCTADMHWQIRSYSTISRTDYNEVFMSLANSENPDWTQRSGILRPYSLLTVED